MSTNFNAGGPGQGPVARVFAVILGAVALAASFMFSLVVVAVLAVVALGVGLYFWWKTRALREAMRESIEAQQRAAEAMGAGTDAPPADGAVIEGDGWRGPCGGQQRRGGHVRSHPCHASGDCDADPEQSRAQRWAVKERYEGGEGEGHTQAGDGNPQFRSQRPVRWAPHCGPPCYRNEMTASMGRRVAPCLEVNQVSGGRGVTPARSEGQWAAMKKPRTKAGLGKAVEQVSRRGAWPRRTPRWSWFPSSS